MVVIRDGAETDGYIFATRTPNVDIHTYYTGPTLKLRAAAHTTLQGISAIPLDQAQDGFNAELAIMATLADKLPPSDAPPGA